MSEPNQTAIFAENGVVLIRHDRPVGTVLLTPEQAQQFAASLQLCAEEAVKQRLVLERRN